MTYITNSADIIDVCDIIARVEELEIARPAMNLDDPELTEAQTLEALLNDISGSGGYEKWRGDWCPAILVRDSYFEDYAQEMAAEIGAIDSAASWPNNCIDWELAVQQLKIDYSSCEFDGVTYWYR